MNITFRDFLCQLLSRSLYSVTYPNMWYTLQFQQNNVYYSTDGGQSFWSSAIVDYGYYTSMPELIESINTAMEKELGNTNITFSLNPRTHKVNVTMAKNHYIALYGQLSKTLGFERRRYQGPKIVRKSLGVRFA